MIRRTISTVVAVTGVAVLAGCGSGRMLPGPGAKLVPGAPSAAVVEQDGIRLSANGDSWQGRPTDLPELMTPVKVRIVNRSGRPVRILYESFALEGASGRTFSPLPPVPLEAEQHPDVTPVRPVFTNSGFFVAAAYRALFPALDPWPERLPRDDAKAEELYRQWDDGLPTREMRRMALLEGVLDAGGQASGFLYFERRAHREKRLLFQAELVDARDGDGISFVKIPFHID